MNDFTVVILAGGKGKRMKTASPKALNFDPNNENKIQHTVVTSDQV